MRTSNIGGCQLWFLSRCVVSGLRAVGDPLGRADGFGDRRLRDIFRVWQQLDELGEGTELRTEALKGFCDVSGHG